MPLLFQKLLQEIPMLPVIAVAEKASDIIIG
jgi:hypothetical protein